MTLFNQRVLEKEWVMQIAFVVDISDETGCLKKQHFSVFDIDPGGQGEDALNALAHDACTYALIRSYLWGVNFSKNDLKDREKIAKIIKDRPFLNTFKSRVVHFQILP